nr:reverse transcriptase domain-containing protein [Tanacetum cinerariifolium]
MRTRSQSRNNFPQQEALPAIVEPLRIELPFLEDQFQEDPPEDPAEVPMADNQTMAELLQAPTEGYEDAIVILEIAANNFELMHVVAKVSTSSSTPVVSNEVSELKDMVRALLLDKKNQSSAPAQSSTPAPVKAIEPNCVTCGGAHSYQNCPATSGNVYRDNIQDFEEYAKPGLKCAKPVSGNANPNSQFDGHAVQIQELMGITTRSGAAYHGPTIPTQSKVVKQGTETGRALIDVHKGKLTLRIENEAISYNLDQTVRYSANYNQMTANKIDVICEMYYQEVLSFFDLTASGNPTPYNDPIFSTTRKQHSPVLTECLPIDECPSVCAMHRARFKGDFSKISRPMTHLLEKNTPFIFFEDCIKSFQMLKKKLTKAPILIAPNWDLPLELMCDASDFAIENLAADHLSRLENPYENVLDPKELNENFPLETLSMVTFRGDSSAPWFADFANYHAGNSIVKEYAPTVNQQIQLPEFLQLDSSLSVPVLKQGDDPIDAINHMTSFLSAVVTSRYPTTNNQLRSSSNPRQQATINNGRVTLQPVQGDKFLLLLGKDTVGIKRLLDDLEVTAVKLRNLRSIQVGSTSGIRACREALNKKKLLLHTRSVCYKKMDQDSTHTVAASKVPMLKPENGNAPPITKVVKGVETTIAPTTAKEKAQRRLELKARSTLLMGIPNEHKLKFNSIKDAKSLL